MSEMSSFYGGRQGNSIVIAKRFDGIDIPQPSDDSTEKPTYTAGFYAVDKNKKFIIVTDGNVSGATEIIVETESNDNTSGITKKYYLIKKNKDNYLGAGINGFADWVVHENNRDKIEASTIIVDNTTFCFPEGLAQGMVQFFRQGAKTSSEVNYGAYVMIDTILNMAATNDPDNGKIFRRGMDTQSDLAGAEYIGQIVGPQGETVELDIQTYDDVAALTPHNERAYNADNDAIVPGSYTIGKTRYYNNEIKYAWATIRDAFGNVEGCQIGFKFPTLIEDYEARSSSPYKNRAKGGDGKYYNYGLIEQDSIEYVDMIKTFAINSENQFILGKATDISSYEVAAAEGTIYLIEKTDDTETSYSSWQAVNFNGVTTITGSDSKTYTLPQIKKWLHPFYQKWQLSVPHGYHGINSEEVEVIHTYTKTPKHKGGSITLYNTNECSETDIYKVVTEENETYRLFGTDYKYITSVDDLDDEDKDAFDKISGKYYMKNGGGYDTNPDVDYAMIQISKDNYVYVKKSDCYMDVLRYKEIDFDELEEGAERYFYLGDYDTIDRVTISEDGTLTVFYTAKADPQNLEQLLRWIDTKDTDGITIDEDGSIHIYYNTLDVEGKHEHQDYPTVLDWITEVSLSESGQFTVLYNNDTAIVGRDSEGNPIYGRSYTTTLQWIDYVDFTDDGTITFRWNTDTTRTGTPAYQFSGMIKYLHDMRIDSIKEGEKYEGTGDQRIHIQFNNDGYIDRPIGEPLNYIIEACISTPTNTYPEAPYSHLLVYYADPELRKKYQSKWVTYPSTKVIDSYITDSSTGKEAPVYHVWTEWVDLGNVRGDAGGVHIIKNVSSFDELKDSKGNYIPPEKLTDKSGTVINPDGFGWGCTCDVEGSTTSKNILFYDYATKEWYSIGGVDSSFIDPSYVILKSKPTEDQMPSSKDVGTLKVNGIWLAAETAIYAH